MQIIDGRKISENILKQLKLEIALLHFQPVFCDILVGNNPVSAQYVRIKARLAEKIGIKFQRADFPESISTEELVAEIHKLNGMENMCGLILQLPLPGHIDRKTALDAIDPSIDVDCTGEVNAKLFYSGHGRLNFPTAAAVLAVLNSLGVNFEHKNILVVGQGDLVGKPVTFLLRQRNLEVNIADKNTPDLKILTKPADVIISAVGKAKLIYGEIIKPGGIVIDAGTSEADNGGIVGDVDFETVSTKAGFLSPVPGGVGPVTVAMLLANVVQVAKSKS